MPPTHTNVYGLGRSLLALSLLLTLLLHSAEEVFLPFGPRLPPSSEILRLGIFSLAGEGQLELGRWAASFILFLVVIGWRPRITGVLHYWVASSFATTGVLLEGGDHIGQVLSALLIPITLTDPRKWHWSAPPQPEESWASAIVARSAWWIIRLQVSLVYFHAAIGKLGVEEWRNGTAVYYWSTHPIFGLPEPALDWAIPILALPGVVMLLTWGALALEVLLFMGLVAEKRWWPWLLAAGLSFHLAIVLVHGLGSFFIYMAGALVLYYRPPELILTWPGSIRAGIGFLESRTT